MSTYTVPAAEDLTIIIHTSNLQKRAAGNDQLQKLDLKR